MTRPSPVERSEHGRLWADDRAQQLIEAATEILETRGADGVRIPEVAAAAGVTRPTVYKHFPNRQALLIAILEHFGEELRRRFNKALAEESPSLEQALRGVIGAICDSLEEGNVGAWKLLISLGPDPEVERVVQEVRRQILQPWISRVRDVTDLPRAEASHICQMLAATTPPVLGSWLAGKLRREQAIEILIRGIKALLREFSRRVTPSA